MSNDFPSREQEAVIARLAIEHRSVAVDRVDPESEIVKITPTNGPTIYLDADGHDVTDDYEPEGAGVICVDVPVELARGLLGAGPVDLAIAECTSYGDLRKFGLGMVLGRPIVREIERLAMPVEAA